MYVHVVCFSVEDCQREKLYSVSLHNNIFLCVLIVVLVQHQPFLP